MEIELWAHEDFDDEPNASAARHTRGSEVDKAPLVRRTKGNPESGDETEDKYKTESASQGPEPKKAKLETSETRSENRVNILEIKN